MLPSSGKEVWICYLFTTFSRPTKIIRCRVQQGLGTCHIMISIGAFLVDNEAFIRHVIDM